MGHAINTRTVINQSTQCLLSWAHLDHLTVSLRSREQCTDLSDAQGKPSPLWCGLDVITKGSSRGTVVINQRLFAEVFSRISFKISLLMWTSVDHHTALAMVWSLYKTLLLWVSPDIYLLIYTDILAFSSIYTCTPAAVSPPYYYAEH